MLQRTLTMGGALVARPSSIRSSTGREREILSDKVGTFPTRSGQVGCRTRERHSCGVSQIRSQSGDAHGRGNAKTRDLRGIDVAFSPLLLIRELTVPPAS